ncbi:hypothetical protein HYU92_06575 [Candidatus Curtissbacteria bacterium]|nr:hypothetical protein [Candidatus Curtissbacteria bacterium]
MDISLGLAIATIIGSISGISGYFLMRQKFMRELEAGKRNQEELARRAYETAVLKEIGERIGYSLDGAKIVEIISGSLGGLLPYSTVSYLIINDESEKVIFACSVKESVSREFVKEVKAKVLAAVSEMTQKPLLTSEVDESITGVILDEKLKDPVRSYFNLPIVVLGKLMGLINVASVKTNLYNDENTEVLYKIARQASDAVSKLQEVLENEKGRLSQAVQSLSEGLLMVDTNYRLLLTNQKLSELLSIAQVPTLFDIVNALSGQLDLRTKMEEVVSKGETLAPWEIVAGGKVLQVLASRVVDNKTGKPIAIVVLFHDITDAKSLEKLRQDFTAMMVHELRAPLTSIKSTVEMLKENMQKVTSDELVKSLATINSSSGSMLKLVADLLDVAKIEAGKFDIISEAGNVGDAAREQVESFRPMAAAKNLKLTYEVGSDLGQGYFDKVRLKQVLNNLLSNAVKYTDFGEVIVKVNPRLVNGYPVDILVSVSDTGVGVEQDQIDKLFSKFGQLEAGKKKTGNSGLGLYIAKGIVEGWGGKIWVESQGSKMGATFNFTVPLASKTTKGDRIQEGEFGSIEGNSQKVAQA